MMYLMEHVFWGTVEADSDRKIERSLRRIPQYAPGCHVFDLAYGHQSFPRMRGYLVQAVREVQPLVPRKGWFRVYASHADGTTIDGHKYLIQAPLPN